MTQAKHTPGPWFVGKIPGKSGKTIHCGALPNGGLNVIARTARHLVQRNAKANARLIAAAPDLLEALEELLGIAFHPNVSGNVYVSSEDRARAAIAKAKGAA